MKIISYISLYLIFFHSSLLSSGVLSKVEMPERTVNTLFEGRTFLNIENNFSDGQKKILNESIKTLNIIDKQLNDDTNPYVSNENMKILLKKNFNEWIEYVENGKYQLLIHMVHDKDSNFNIFSDMQDKKISYTYSLGWNKNIELGWNVFKFYYDAKKQSVNNEKKN